MSVSRAAVVMLVLAGMGCTDEKVAPVLGDPGAGGGPVSYSEPYSIQLFDRTRINSKSEKENFQNAMSDVTFGEQPVSQATLVIDLDTTCYPFETWADNPPPDGHNWPADCDAFDRNFEWTLDPPTRETDPPGIELVRAITPFGGPRHLEVDITDIVNGVDAGWHRVRAHITTWSDGAGQVSGSDGGWFISGRIDLTPGPPPRDVLAVIPLYDKSTGATNQPGPQSFIVPEGTTFSRFEYRVTGHGGGSGGLGCIGPAEEFCDRIHTIRFDDVDFLEFHPWRTDCASFCTLTYYQNPDGGGFNHCLENPCGAEQSVRAPRANWCPGELTPPIYLEPELWPGEHTMEWSVNAIAEGGSWRTSVTYFAFGSP